MSVDKYYEISYVELDAKVELLYKKIEEDFIPDSMLAVARGGSRWLWVHQEEMKNTKDYLV